ncbi:MFS transporter [Neokomagataea tanensis]|uniref:MFS transporter n=2 Tax=Neokomagataea TaxID=1223423 RepID=A0A4Y6V5B9_9PROT|nr:MULTISPECIES: MFS transporter [Neokomagataea]QDH25249.1 MFS transporter [Neokomagataea tanensis]
MRKVLIYVFTVVMCIICYGDRAALSVSLPKIIDDFGLSASQAGWVLSSFLWSYFFLNLPSSLLLDRLGPRVIGFGAVAIWSAAMVEGSLAFTLPAFLLSRVVLGVGESPTFSLGAKVMRKWSSPQRAGLAMTFFTNGISIGLGAGAVSAGYLVSAFGWRRAFLILGCIGFLWCLAWLFVYPPDEERPALRKPRITFSVRPFFASKSFWGIVIGQSCANYANFLMMSWLPVILKKNLHLSLAESGLYTAYCYGGAVIVSIVAGKLGERFCVGRNLLAGDRRYVVSSYLVMIAIIGVLPFLHSVLAIMLCLVLSMGFVTACTGANMALLADLLVEHETLGAANGLLLTFSNGIGILAPVVTGYILQFTGGFEDVFYMVAVLLLAGSIGSALLPKETISVAMKEGEAKCA